MTRRRCSGRRRRCVLTAVSLLLLLLLSSFLLLQPFPVSADESSPTAPEDGDGDEEVAAAAEGGGVGDPDEEDKEDEDEESEEGDIEEAVQFQSRRQILSFGGNGMVGTSVLTKLIATDLYDITLVSRGSWPFDSSVLVKPHVKHIKCDRSDKPDCPDEDEDPIGWEECDENALTHSCPELIDAMGASDDYYAVLDLSGYRGEWVQDAVEELGEMVRVYIYVSTDSVYEVSVGGGPEGARGEGSYMKTGKKTTEDMAVRPDDRDELRDLVRWDSYGHRKLEGEEILEWQREEEEMETGEMWDGFPYVSLRFADILGPRDGTGRYATYHIWAKYAGRVEGVPPFHIQRDVVEATSVTYVEDAAQAILKVMDDPTSWDEAYNVACEEVFNATEMLPTLGRILGGDDAANLSVEKRPRRYSIAMFPSVTRGPIDIAKARERLKFQPTPLETVLEETAAWYEHMFLHNEEVRNDMIEEFVEDVLDEDKNDYEEVVERLWEAVREDVRRAQEEEGGEERRRRTDYAEL